MITLGITSYAVPSIPEIVSAKFSPEIKLLVDGEPVQTPIVSVVTKENPGYMTNFAPIREVCEKLGATVTWDGKSRTITVESQKSTDAAEKESVSMATNTKEVENMSTSPDIPFPVYTVDDTGINVYNVRNAYNGVLPSDILNALKNKNMVLRNAPDGETLQIADSNGNVIVSGITVRANGGKIFVPYDLFLEKIKPLLK